MSECKFKFTINFCKQINGCIMMWWPLHVTFSDRYLVKTENEVTTPLRTRFYRRYANDIFNRRKKKFVMKIFFSKASAIIKKTSTLSLKLIQLNSLKQSLIVLMVFTRQWCIGRQQNC